MDSEEIANDEIPQTSRRTVLRSAVWTAPVVATAVAAPAFAASPATLTFSLSRIGADSVRLTVTGGRNGVSIRINNLGLLNYTGIEGVTKQFAGGSVTFDQTGGNGLFVGGVTYNVTFTYDTTAGSLAVAAGGSTTTNV